MDIKSFSIARINKDKNFDGKFLFGVSTTGIFCRPSCPSPIAKEENVTYFLTLYEALSNGYRPCLRCRPDMTVEYISSNIDGQMVVKKAIYMISHGFLNTNTICDLAKKLHISERHLRKLFVKEVGCPPIQVAKYHKAIFAKKLLLNSGLTIIDIAFASGFGSIRQFNHTFRNMFDITPSEFRKYNSKNTNAETSMYLPYKNNFDFGSVIEFLKPRAIKGIEVVTNDSYSRTFCLNGNKGYFIVTDNKEKQSLELKIFCDNMNSYMLIYYKVRRMFDLDANLTSIRSIFNKDELLYNFKIPPLPVAFNSYEFVIRAILGQQITIKAATTLAERIVKRANIKYDTELNGLTHIFPNIDDMKDVSLEELGITKNRIITIDNVNKALLDGELSLSMNQSYDAFCRDFIKIKGIGDWTVNYVAMRGLGMVDAFPAGDLGVIKALSIGGKKISRKEIITKAEQWRPYRAYATLCLWNSLKEK